MGLNQLVKKFPWERYSQKLMHKITTPRSMGLFSSSDASERKMRLVIGKEGSVDDGNCVSLYCLVDPEDGVIADARFQLFGASALFGACESACEVLVGKHYSQASHVTSYLLDKPLRDNDSVEAFPVEMKDHLELVISAIEKVTSQCEDLPKSESYEAPPVPDMSSGISGEGFPGWMELSLQKKLEVIEHVLNDDLRPYIEMDGGGVKVVNLINNREVIISYQGACTSCFSSVGATLSYIQQTFRAKVHPDLVVIPDMTGTDLPY